jgi:hypothetical protein
MDQSQLCLGCMENSEGAAFCPHCGWRRSAAPQSPLYLAPGTVLLDQYVVGRALGPVASSISYLAWDRGAGRKVTVKEFFPEGIAARLQDAAVAPQSGQEQAYQQSLEKFLSEGQAVPPALNSFRANGSAYLVMESVKELAIAAPWESAGAQSSFKDVSGLIVPALETNTPSRAAGELIPSTQPSQPATTQPPTVTELPKTTPPVQSNVAARPWLKWVAAFFVVLLAGGIVFERQQQQEREAQLERERQREIAARKERELQLQREIAAQKERELQRQRELAAQKEWELQRQQGIIEAQQRELLRQRELQRQLQLRRRQQQAVVDPRRNQPPGYIPPVTRPQVRQPDFNTPARLPMTYEQLLSQAQAALRRNSPQAAQLAEQAIQAGASKPGGYEVLGYSRLYFFGDPRGAETAMRAAMIRGGSAVFRVKHDHANGSFQRFCSGVLLIGAAGVSYAAADNSDRFDASAAEIQDVNRNKMQRRSFHVKTSTRNYNFGPTSNQPDAEVALAVRLLGR